MMEHFGLPYDQIKDPLAVREKVSEQARNNSLLYYEIFKCEPDNQIKNFAELKVTRAQRQEVQSNILEFTQKYLKLKSEIVGHAVEYPVYFLNDEKLGKSLRNQEILVPEIAFV